MGTPLVSGPDHAVLRDLALPAVGLGVQAGGLQHALQGDQSPLPPGEGRPDRPSECLEAGGVEVVLGL